MPVVALLLFSAFIFLQGGSSATPTQMEHQAKHGRAAPDTMKEPVYENLHGYGKKCWIGDSLYFTYKFDKKPKMGTAILIVRLFDKKDGRLSNLQILGSSAMPSMRGAHDSGEVPSTFSQLTSKGLARILTECENDIYIVLQWLPVCVYLQRPLSAPKRLV